MPNWCENELTILCFDKATADAVVESICEQVEQDDGTFRPSLSFDKVLPQPDHIGNDTLVSDSGMPDWWYWRIQNWGTKWDAEQTTCPTVHSRADGKTEITFVFDTAWAPSVPVSEEIARKFPNTIVAHSYDEPGMDFGGFTVWADGEVTEEENGGSRSTTWADYADIRMADYADIRMHDVLYEKQRANG